MNFRRDETQELNNNKLIDPEHVSFDIQKATRESIEFDLKNYLIERKKL